MKPRAKQALVQEYSTEGSSEKSLGGSVAQVDYQISSEPKEPVDPQAIAVMLHSFLYI